MHKENHIFALLTTDVKCMNKTDVVKRVSVISEVNAVDCERVIHALEKVLQEELSSSGISGTFKKFRQFMKIFKQ